MRKPYIWFALWVVFTSTVVVIAVNDVKTGASTWRLLFDALHLFLGMVTCIDGWHRLKNVKAKR